MPDAAFNGFDGLLITIAVLIVIANYLYEKGSTNGRDR